MDRTLLVGPLLLTAAFLGVPRGAHGQGPAAGPPGPAPSQVAPEPSPLPNPTPVPPTSPTEPSPSPPPEAAGPVQGPASDAPGLGPGGLSPFFNPIVGRAPFRADYRATWFPSEPVAGQPTSLGYVQQAASVAFPIWQDGAVDEWSASVSTRGDIIQTHAILPDTRQPFPDELWDVRLGTTYRHLFSNGWIAGGTVSVGSASDRPFHSIDEMTAGVNAFLRVPQGEHNAWLFTLSYSATGELPIPIPGVAFVWQPSPDFRANLGLPFQVMWRPVEDLTLDFSYMLLTTVHARASYRVCRLVCVYAAYASENESYFLVDRPDSNDRFFHVDQRAASGVLLRFCPQASLDLSGGYVFDNHFFQGKNITNGTGFDRVDVGAGPYASVQLLLRW